MDKKTSISISDDNQKFLKENFNNVSAGISTSIDILRRSKDLNVDAYDIIDQLQFLQQIRRASLREIQGIFLENEWGFIVDILNGTLIPAEFRCLQSGLIAEMEDAEHFDSSATKWNVDLQKISDKVRSLTGAQIDAIYYRVKQFWDDPNRDLDSFTKW